MFILSNRNVILPYPDGSGAVRIRRDFVGEVPDAVTGTEYFAALVKEGKIVMTQKSDKEVQKAAEQPVNAKRKAKSME